MTRHMTVAEFVRNTPNGTAERIECEECGDEYIGDPTDGSVCPGCQR